MNSKCCVCLCQGVVSCECSKEVFCDFHIFEHLSKDVEHEVKYLLSNDKGFSDIRLDEDDLLEYGVLVSGHRFPVSALALSSDKVFTAEKDGVYMWKQTYPSSATRIDTDFVVWSVAVSEKSNLVAAGLDTNEVLITEYSDFGGKKGVLTRSGPVLAVLIVDYKKIVCCGTAQGTLEVFEVKEKLETESVFYARVNHGAVLCMASDLFFRFLAVGGADGVVSVYDLSDFSRVHKLSQHQKAVTCVKIVETLEMFSAGLDGQILVYSLNTKTITKKIEHREGEIYAICVENQGNHLYFSDSTNGLFFIDFSTDSLKQCLLIEPEFIRSIEINHSGIFTILGDKSVKLYNPQKLSDTFTIGNSELMLTKPTKDNLYLICGYRDGKISVFSLKTLTLEYDFDSFAESKAFLDHYPYL